MSANAGTTSPGICLHPFKRCICADPEQCEWWADQAYLKATGGEIRKPRYGGELEQHDQLPPTIKRALEQFHLNMSSRFALDALRAGRSEKELLRMLNDRRTALGEFNPKA
jgi:hypothetical protein